MNLVDREFFDTVKPLLFPGTVLLDVDTFQDSACLIKITMSVVRRPDHWAIPAYAMWLGALKDGKPVWSINPWMTDAALHRLSILIPPSLLLARLTPDDSVRLTKHALECWPELESGT